MYHFYSQWKFVKTQEYNLVVRIASTESLCNKQTDHSVLKPSGKMINYAVGTENGALFLEQDVH